MGYTYAPSSYRTNFGISHFTNNEFFVNLDCVFLKDFIFKANYSRFDFENKAADTANIFEIANASLFYQKENSSWGFEIEATNLFDTGFKRSNSFTDFLISDQTTFIMPRIVLFKVSYKL